MALYRVKQDKLMALYRVKEDKLMALVIAARTIYSLHDLHQSAFGYSILNIKNVFYSVIIIIIKVNAKSLLF
jgi:hypothetical protein